MFPLSDTQKPRRLPLVNWSIIIVNAAVFFYVLQFHPLTLTEFFNTWGLVPVRVWADPLVAWTIFTGMFLHTGGVHFTGNMWVLFVFGKNVEDRLGRGQYLLFYLLCGLSAGLVQMCFLSESSVPMVGASGAIAGVLGGYLILYPQAQILTFAPILLEFKPIEIPVIALIVIWFSFQFISGFLSLAGVSWIGFAWRAHLGGFAFGLLSIYFFTRLRRNR
jgi:membrane associated rhomboid family serine protease